MAGSVDLSDLKGVLDSVKDYFSGLDTLSLSAWIMIAVGLVLIIVGAILW